MLTNILRTRLLIRRPVPDGSLLERFGRAVTAGLFVALLLGTLLITWEAVLIRSSSVSLVSALGAATAGMLPWLVLTLVLAGVVAAPLSSPRIDRWLDSPEQRSLVVCGAGCAGLAGYGFYGAAKAAQIWLVAEGTRMIASAIFAVVVLIILAVLWFSLRRITEGWLSDSLSTRAWLAILIAGLLPWSFGFWLLEPEVFAALNAPAWTPAWALLMIGIIAGLLVHLRRPTMVISVLCAIGLCGLASSYWLSAPSPKLESAIEQRSRLTSKLLGLQWRFIPSQEGTTTTARSTYGGSCWPGKKAVAPASIGQAKDKAPDILLVMVDGVRWDRTSLGGYKRNTTPNLKRFAPKGVSFERAYSNSASTRQTFRSLLTGLYPNQVGPSIGRNRWALTFPEGQETLASYLQAAGYHTISAQTSTVFFDKGTHGLHGFEEDDRLPQRAWRARRYSADTHVDRIIAHLSDPQPAKPRFVFSHLMEPHKPFGVGPKRKFHSGKQSRYLSGIHYADQQLGRLIKFVLSPERRKNTILIIGSDHGHGHHGTSVADSQTRVPFLWFGAGIKPRKIAEAVGLIDIMPTLLDFAGVTVPGHVCGQSLRPVLLGKHEFEPRPLLVQTYPDKTTSAFRTAFIENGHKLTVDSRKHITRLFQLKDTSEDDDDDLGPEDPEKLARYVTRLRQYLSERGLDPAEYLE